MCLVSLLGLAKLACCGEAFSVPRQLSSGACRCRTVTTVFIHTDSPVLMHMSSHHALALYVSGLALAAGLESGTSLGVSMAAFAKQLTKQEEQFMSTCTWTT
ncbi:hypothetical protein V3481_011767 [Fusarium oxysporum f. sp. vasinfectum]|jgi:hypothetical protein